MMACCQMRLKQQYVYKTRKAVDFNGNSRGEKSVAQVSEHILLSSFSNWKTSKKIHKESELYHTKYMYITHSSYHRAVLVCRFLDAEPTAETIKYI